MNIAGADHNVRNSRNKGINRQGMANAIPFSIAADDMLVLRIKFRHFAHHQHRVFQNDVKEDCFDGQSNSDTAPTGNDMQKVVCIGKCSVYKTNFQRYLL